MGPIQILLIIFGLLNLAFAGFLYIHSDKKQVITFYVLISTFASLWSLSTLLTDLSNLTNWELQGALWGHYIFGFLAYLSFFWFTLYFPAPPKKPLFILAIICSISSVLFVVIANVRSYLFSIVTGVGLADRVLFHPIAYPLFIIVLSAVFSLGLIILLVKLSETAAVSGYNSSPAHQIYFALLANFIAGLLGITLNLLLPLYGNFSLFYINPILVTLALICIGFYDLLKYHLFNVKVVLAEFFAAGIWILFLARVAFSTTLNDFLVNGIIFLGSLFFGAFLVQSVLNEVRAREKIEKLAQDLEKANDQQVILIHFITHQLKGFVTKSRNIFSLLMEGDYGTLPDQMRPMVEEGFRSDTKGAETIQEILNAANIKSGKVTYKMATFDLKGLIEEIVKDLKPIADAKGLELKLALPDDVLEYNGDREQLLNAFKNLIDNSIKYTPSGTTEIILRKENAKIHFEVKDTGVGITSEDMKNLFTEGGHGKESQKVNVESTGFGLFIVKNIIEGHGGKIWAESEGAGKGSRFIIELPAT